MSSVYSVHATFDDFILDHFTNDYSCTIGKFTDIHFQLAIPCSQEGYK